MAGCSQFLMWSWGQGRPAGRRYDGGTAVRRSTARRAPTAEQFGRPVMGSIPTTIRAFKSAATKRINEHCGTPGQPVWQRNYYEHVIRDDADMGRIRDYIENNPARWDLDELYFVRRGDLPVARSRARGWFKGDRQVAPTLDIRGIWLPTIAGGSGTSDVARAVRLT